MDYENRCMANVKYLYTCPNWLEEPLALYWLNIIDRNMFTFKRVFYDILWSFHEIDKKKKKKGKKEKMKRRIVDNMQV